MKMHFDPGSKPDERYDQIVKLEKIKEKPWLYTVGPSKWSSGLVNWVAQNIFDQIYLSSTQV